MKLVLKAEKLKRAFTIAREVAAKAIDVHNILSQHVLMDFSQENQITFLAGDKELNHSYTVTLEEAEYFEFPEVFERKENGNIIKQLSVSCNSVADAITGVHDSTLIHIEFPKVPAPKELTHANLTYDTTVVRVEASNGQGYALLAESFHETVSISTLTLPERLLKDVIQSTIFCVSLKASKHASLHTLIFSLTPTKLTAFGGDYARIALCDYIFDENAPKPYVINGFDVFSENEPLRFNLSRRTGIELQNFLKATDESITLTFYLTKSGNVQYLHAKRVDEELIFNLTYCKPPQYQHIVPDNLNHHAVVNATEVRDKLNRSTKFGEVILLTSEPGLLRLSSSNPGTIDSFSTDMPAHTNDAEPPLNLRVHGKHFIDLINPLQESAKMRGQEAKDVSISLNFSHKKVPVFVVSDMTTKELNRLYILTPFNNMNADNSETA